MSEPDTFIGEGGESIAHISQLKSIRTDQQIADEMKARALKIIEELNVICSEAERNGFRIIYQQGQDAFGGRFFTQVFQILKKMG